VAENKKDILKMAMIYAQEGRWDKAISEYKKLLTLDPTDYTIQNMLGDVYAKKEEDALAYQAYIVAAEAYANQGLADKAIIIYKKIGKLDSEKLPKADRDKQILIKRNTVAEKLIEEGQVDRAIDEYKEILKANPANFETYQKLGELYTQKGDQKEALNCYRKIVEVYFKNRLYKKALPIYQKILEIQPDSIATREKIAEIYEREGNESDAKREYLYLAEYYWNERNMVKTDYYAQKAVDFKSIEAHYFKGAALALKKEYGEAKKELDMLLKFKANHIGALISMAEIYRDTNQQDEAIATLNKIVKAEPDNTDGYLLLGEAFLKKNMKKEAAARYLSAANIFVKKNEKEKGAELLKNVLEQDPENIDLLVRLAEIQTQANRKKEAADAYLKISDIYTKENMPDKAQENYKLAVEIDPAHPTIVDKAKKMGMAVKPSARIETEGTDTFASYDPGKNADAMARTTASAPAGAVKQNIFLNGAAGMIDLTPNMQQAPAKNVMAAAQEQIKETANPASSDMFASGPTKEDIPSMIAMADSFVKMGSFDEAIESYQKALTLDPGNENIKSKLNMAYSQYAGIPLPDPKVVEAERKRREEVEKSRKIEEEKRKKEYEEIVKNDEEKKKNEKAAAEKAAAQRAETELAERKKIENTAREAAVIETEKKEKEVKPEQKPAETEIKKIAPAAEETIEEPEISDDFVTVTTAEIFMKQGLLTEAEKILKRIMAKDSENMEARMRLDELKKMMADMPAEDAKPAATKEETGPKGSKVSYI
jgi:tetratricopeptide (TPR) repeat protein